MNICIAGKNNIAVDILLYAIKHVGAKHIFVIPNKNDTGKNKWQKSLLFYANLTKTPVVKLEDVYDIPDLIFLSLEFDRIIKPVNFKTKYLYNIHFSLLPAYKGMYTSLLPVLNGETLTGVTFHKIDSGIDTGDIILQKEIPITDQTTCRNLYFNYLKEGTNIVIDLFHNIINNNVSSCIQPKSGSTYYSKHSYDFRNRNINLSQTAFQIQRNCNALIFREYQMPDIHGKTINRIKITDIKSTNKPGYIVSEDNEKMIISSIDYDYVAYKDYYNILLNAAQKDDTDVFNEIKKYIINVDEKDSNGWTPLIIACYNGSINVIKGLLEAGANPNLTNLNGTTPLMYAKDNAVKTGKTEILTLLKTSGADINLRDIYNKTVFDYLAVPEHNFIINKLKE